MFLEPLKDFLNKHTSNYNSMFCQGALRMFNMYILWIKLCPPRKRIFCICAVSFAHPLCQYDGHLNV